MELNNHSNDQLEQFLKEEVADHTMYPSEFVWENIRTEIHGNPSWPALSFIAITIIFALTISTLYNYPPKTITTRNGALVKKTDKLLTANNSTADIAETENESIEKRINDEIYSTVRWSAENDNSGQNLTANAVPALLQSTILQPITIEKGIPVTSITVNRPAPLKKEFISGYNIFFDEPVNTNLSDNAIVTETKPAIKNTKKSRYQNLVLNKHSNFSDDNSVDDYLNQFGFQNNQGTVVSKKKRFDFQMYLTPSNSYRKLQVANPVNNGPQGTPMIPLNIMNSINKGISNTPVPGIEAGTAITYKLTNRIKIKAGLQLNVRQFYIDAGQVFGISTAGLVQNNHLDSASLASLFSKNTGNNLITNYFNTRLDNKIYQLSAPVGFQWDIFRVHDWGLSTSGTIQPTLTLNKNEYLVTSDFKYYSNGAALFRIWNLNSSIELNVTYRAGNLIWFAGPQLRFQYLPTFNNAYPVREYRNDYGFKIGVSTTLF